MKIKTATAIIVFLAVALIGGFFIGQHMQNPAPDQIPSETEPTELEPTEPEPTTPEPTETPTQEEAEGDVVVSWTSSTTRGLWDVFMVSADDGWAVGEQGAIVRWNGTNWNNVTSPSIHSAEPRLKSVFMVSADDGWAVGECPAYVPTRDIHENIIHWNGTCWNRVASPVVCMLSSVFMVSADDGWAVGKDGVFFGDDHWALPGPERVGRIIHWDGSSWNNVTSPTKSWLSSVFMVSADDGWAVGSSGTTLQAQLLMGSVQFLWLTLTMDGQ